MSIVLCGKKGKLGSFLNQHLSKNHNLVALSREDIDFFDERAFRKKIISLKPEIIINAAAYTDVDLSEKLKEYALKINFNFTQFISSIALRIDATLIHFSTDYVFDGKKDSPYKETDLTNPINFYGLSKLYGERSIIDSSCRFLIFRISTLLGGYKDNLVYKILHKGFKNEEFTVVSDQLITPTSVEFIAKNIELVLNKNIYDNFRFNNIYHLSPKGEISPFQLANLLFEIFNEKIKKDMLNKNKIKSILQKDFQSAAIRPKNCILNSNKFYKAVGQIPEVWDDQFNLFANRTILKLLKENSLNI